VVLAVLGAARGWTLKRQLAVLAAGNFVVAINIHILAGLLNQVSVSLGVSIGEAGLLIAAASGLTCLAAPLCATWGSGLDRRHLLGGALFVCAISCGLGALSQTYSQLMSTRLLGALTSAIFMPQAAATVVLMVDEKRRPQALGLVLMGLGGALVVGVPVGVLIGTTFGWRSAMACLSAAALALSVIVWLALPAGLKVARLNLQSWRSVFGMAPLLWMLTAIAMMSAANAGAVSYLAPMTAALPQAGPHTVSVMFFVHGAAWMAGTAAPGLLVRRIGGLRLAFAGMLFTFAAFALRPLVTDSLPLVYAVQVMWGLGSACFFAVQQARVVGVAPELSAASIALSSSLNYLGFALGAMFGASVWGFTGPRYLTWAMAWMPVCTLAFTLLSQRAAACAPAAAAAAIPGR